MKYYSQKAAEQQRPVFLCDGHRFLHHLVPAPLQILKFPLRRSPDRMLRTVIIHQQPRSLFPPEMTATISRLAWRGKGTIEHTEYTCRHWTAAPQRCKEDCHIVKVNGPNGFLIYFKKILQGVISHHHSTHIKLMKTQLTNVKKSLTTLAK